MANRLDSAMNASGMKRQIDLARKSGVSQATVNRLLKGVIGERESDIPVLYKLAKACGVTVEWLITGQDASSANIVNLIMATNEEATLLTKYRQLSSKHKKLVILTLEQAEKLSK